MARVKLMFYVAILLNTTAPYSAETRALSSEKKKNRDIHLSLFYSRFAIGTMR